MGYYPIAVDLTDRKCLIIGGGVVALRKAQSLLEAGARVTVIAPEVDAAFEKLSEVEVMRRDYKSGDVSGHTLVFAATNNRNLNDLIAKEAMQSSVHVNVVDDPELCSFIVPSLIRRGNLLIAISTSGKSPALSKKIRRELEDLYGEEYAVFVDLLGEMRELVKSKYKSQPEREAVFNKLLNSGIIELIREGKMEEARERALQCI